MLSANGRASAGGEAAERPDPVFVLCMGRSGSTLLRFILDAHPDLACPPETNLPALCGQLAVVWSLIEGAPLSEVRGDTPPLVPDAAIAGVRHTIDAITGSYLRRRGKRRFCDKSLGAARYAELLLRVHPEAKFLCLYRHPMDVIRSGIDACPWGLNGYGFDAYIGGSPGNAVLALARFWLENAQAIAAAEENYPAHCHRVRYEDLAGSPAQTATAIFDFIGVPGVADIEERVYAAEHERFGPGDHKIWHTSGITSSSVGRGESVPAGLIPPPVLEAMNELADRLGYVRIDESWGTPDMARELRADVPAAPAVRTGPGTGNGERTAALALLAERLRTGIAAIDTAFTERWQACLTDSFDIAVRSPDADDTVCWRINLGGLRAEVAPDSADEAELDWSIVGSPQAWAAVLRGERNLSAALRHCEVRYCDLGDTGAAMTDARIAMLAELLGVTRRRRSGPAAAPCGPAAVAENIPAVIP